MYSFFLSTGSISDDSKIKIKPGLCIFLIVKRFNAGPVFSQIIYTAAVIHFPFSASYW